MKRLIKTTDSTGEVASRFSEARERVRVLLAEDRIEEALHQVKEVDESQSGDFSHELIILTRRFNKVTREERIKTLTREEADAEKNQIVKDLLRLMDQLDRHSRKRSHGRKPALRAGNAESAARIRYLGILKENVQNLLDVSIHKARMKDLGIEDEDLNIDLDMSDTPAATSLPWVYRDPNMTREFTHIEEALDTYERRLLLLGGPGSGKTTTLLTIAKRLIREAEADPAAPLPLLVNLSKLQLKAPATSFLRSWVGEGQGDDSRDDRVERWLVTELTTGYPGISTDIAQSWIKGGRVAALLDGLDEVNDEYRAKLAQLLNATFLRDYPDSVVVVCSRINEYQPLQDSEETRLQLKGAVTLQPLTRSQIGEYLEKAQATGLGDALLNDEMLYQMAQTPLMLSMMTLAYGGVAPAAIPTHLSRIERRHHLMEAYVARMLQRKERRDRRIPFDEDKRKDVSVQRYAYRPEQINSYLGWLAVRLSVRMQTAVSFHALYKFLTREIQRDRQSGVWWATVIARAPLVFFSALLAGLAVAPMTAEAGRQILYIALLAVLCFVPADWGFRSEDNAQSEPERATWHDTISRGARALVGGGVIYCLVIATILGGLAAISIALSSALPFGIPPADAGIIAICLSIVGVAILLTIVEKPSGFKYWIIGSSSVVFIASLALMWQLEGYEYRWSIPAVSLAAIQSISAAVFVKIEEGSWWGAGSVLGVAAGTLVSYPGIIESIGELSWYKTLPVCAAAAVLTLSGAEKPLLPLGVLTLSFATGGIVGGATGSAIGLMIYGYLLIVNSILEDASTSQTDESSRARFIGGILSFTAFVAEWLERTGDRYLLSPVLLRVLALTRCLPLRFKPFSEYAERALLLKRSAGDVEFMHRLLRDYFALRDLQPLLSTPDFARRLEAIRNLGFQGDATIDALAEFVRAEEPEIREAAAWAFGRMVSPEIIPHLEVALQDESPKVRSTATYSIKNLPVEDFFRLLSLVLDDKDLSVQRACIEIALSSLRYQYAFGGEGHQFKERMLANIKARDELRQIIFQLLETHHDDDLRREAIETIVHLKDKRGVPSIITALSDRKFESRLEAISALGKLGDPRAVKPLTRVLSRRDKDLRTAAAAALRMIGTPEALAAARRKKK